MFVSINGKRMYLWRAVDCEGEVLGGFNRSSQQLDKGGCDDDSKAALRSIRAEQVAFARPTPDSATGELSAVLGVDRCRLFD